MTRDLIESYKKYFKDDKVVLDSYKLSNGYYYLFNDDNSFQKLIVKDGEGDNQDLYDKIKALDYYSVYLVSNKAMGSSYTEVIDGKKYNMLKKIGSTNIYTLFFKNKSIKGICIESDEKEALPVTFFETGIQKYYDSLLSLEGYTKEETDKYANIMQDLFNIAYDDLRQEQLPKDVWIKIYINKPLEEYIKVSNYYVSQKIFNSNDNMIKKDEKIYGINNYNYNQNSKKPFLELKSTSYKVSSLIDLEDIAVLRRIYIWLYNNASKLPEIKIPMDFEFKGYDNTEQEIKNEDVYTLKVTNDNGNARIDSFEYVPNYNTTIKKFEFKDILNKDEKVIYSTNNIYGLEWLINNVWITNNLDNKRNILRQSYYDFENSVSKAKGLSNWKKEFLQKYKDCFKDLVQKQDTKAFVKNLDEMAEEIISNLFVEDEEYKKGNRYNSQRAFNLWLVLSDYFNRKENKIMKINDVMDRCSKIVNENGKIKNDDEYYFLIGQIAYYLINKSKANKLTQDVAEPFVKANNYKTLIKELKYLYDRYGYALYFRSPKFNNIYSQILLIEPDSKVKDNKDIILAGLLANNLFYNKDNGGNVNEEE